MSDMLLTKLADIEVDVERSLERFMNNEALYVKFLKKFPQTDDMEKLGKLIENEDYQNAELVAHTLKGVTGNLGITPLYFEFTFIVDMLRANQFSEIDESFERAQTYYIKICETINEYS